MKKIYVLFTLIMMSLSLFVISGCKKEKKIVVGEVTHSVFYAPQYVAFSEKIFEKYDLDVELILLSGADKVMASLLSEDIQIGLMGPEASIYVYAQGRKDYAITFAQLTQKDGTFIVGREKIEDFSLADMAGKSILGGRKGGMPFMTLEYVLKEAKVYNEVNVRSDVAFSAMIGAFSQGEGDFTTAFEPSATELELNGKGFVLSSVGEYTYDLAYTCYQSLKSYIDKNEELITNFTYAIADALEWVRKHTDEEVAKSIHKYFSETKIEVLTNSIKRYRSIGVWSLDPYLDSFEYKHLQDIIIEAKELEKYMPYNVLVDNKYPRILR